ncbi:MULTISPECIES: plasmid mobilization protein [Pseudomonas]|uniref:plasmid mobilization protein n=1 Tax=Pseudomonas TaxID=286 RepID=UPI000DAE20C1|nr:MULTISPECIES: CopG family transcriptional regulator [Pseudomonas]MCA5971856.1 CopG family transcriptional regulator [Pseudomonas sp. P135]MCH5570194.1 CopG family transcriptional regulator [Pseudomonas syringae pv. syringae]
MTSNTNAQPSARRRGKTIEVWVTEEEKAIITARAKEAGMARSAYLRAFSLNTPVRSVVDLSSVTELARINGDMSRAAALLKLCLAHKHGEGMSTVDLEATMLEFRRLQVSIGKEMGSIVNAHK